MIVSLKCNYCGCYWERYVPKKSEFRQPSCLKCGDQDISVRDLAKSKVDYYAGAPKFPSEIKDIANYEEFLDSLPVDEEN